MMKQACQTPKKILSLLALFCVSFFCVDAQTNAYPVGAQMVLSPRAPIYLSDYYSKADQPLQVNLILNDLNEEFLDVYLKIKFESDHARLSQLADFKPMSSFTLYPGELSRIMGVDLTDYLIPQNLNIEGLDVDKLKNTGRLPEGRYKISVQAFEYHSGKAVSGVAETYTEIRLLDAPNIVLPANKTVIKNAQTVSQIPVSWFQNDARMNETEYYLSLFELNDNQFDPSTAIDNNQAKQIFRSEAILGTSYQLEVATLNLTQGKTYLLQLESKHIDNKDLFKNNGKSEIRYFHFGYPTGGSIKLKRPQNKAGFAIRDMKYFSWEKPDNYTLGQPIDYHFKIVLNEEGLDPEKVIVDNMPYEEAYIKEEAFANGGYYELKIPMYPSKEYAWQVTAITEDVEVASSPVYSVFGPSRLEEFLAGSHKVKVTKAYTNDITKFSGEGKIDVGHNLGMVDIVFENLHIKNASALYILHSGKITKALDGIDPFVLNADYKDNGDLLFKADSLVLDDRSMRIRGVTHWNLPLPVDSDEQAVVKSVPTWVNYDDKLPSGRTYLDSTNQFNLLEPNGYRLELATRSYFLLSKKKYYLNSYGEVALPFNIDEEKKDRVRIPFQEAENLFFIRQKGLRNTDRISLFKEQTNIFLEPREVFFDFSEKETPSDLDKTAEWKGVFFKEFDLVYTKDFDHHHQLFFDQEVKKKIIQNAGDSITCRAEYNGLQFEYRQHFDDKDAAKFNTFPARFHYLDLKLENSEFSKGQVHGDIKIPLISDSTRFDFTVPMSTEGLMSGYLDEGLDDYEFEYNKGGGEQELFFRINRAVFADKERIDMNVDIHWPHIGIRFEKIPGLKAWGNYDIGFGRKEGAFALQQQMQGNLNGFQITVDEIGAGRQGDTYAIGVSTKMVMSDDVSGIDGPPIANLYSVVSSRLLADEYTPVPVRAYENISVSYPQSSYVGDPSIGQVDPNAAFTDTSKYSVQSSFMGEDSEANQSFQQQLASIQLEVDSTQIGSIFINNESTSSSTADEDWPEDVDITNMSPEEIKQYLIEVIDALVPYLPEQEQKDKLLQFKDLLKEFNIEELITLKERLFNLKAFLKEVIEAQIAAKAEELMAGFNKNLKNIRDSVNVAIDKKSKSITLKFCKKIEAGVDSLAAKITSTASGKNKEKIIKIINDAKDGAKASFLAEFKKAIANSVDKNLKGQVAHLTDSVIGLRLTNFVVNSLSELGGSVIDGSSSGVMKQVGENAGNMLEDLASDVKDLIHPENLKRTVENLAVDIYNGLNWNKVGEDMLWAAAGSVAQEIIKDFIENNKDKINEIANKAGEKLGNLASGFAEKINLDMSGVKDKFAKLKPEKVKLDPSGIKVVTSVADFEGYVRFTHDDPIWGDSWQAELGAQIKIQPKFNVNAKYVNGSKIHVAVDSVSGASDSTKFKFWFLEFGVSKLNIPMSPLPISLDGAKGRVFKAMRRIKSEVYHPDPSIRYGAGIQMYMFDTGGKGSIIVFDVGMELTFIKGGFAFEMFGNAVIGNQMSDGEVKSSLAFGEGYLGYNSVEKHFLATLNMRLEAKPFLCANAESRIEFGDKKWQIAMGTREKPFTLDLLCLGKPIFMSWLDVNQRRMDWGVMIKINVDLEGPWIGIPGVKVKPWAKFSLDMGASTIIAWKPEFGVEEARVWIDIYAGIGIKYKFFLKKGNFTIAAVNLGGEALFRTTPDTFIKGKLYGKVTVFGCSVGFNFQLEHTF